MTSRLLCPIFLSGDWNSKGSHSFIKEGNNIPSEFKITHVFTMQCALKRMRWSTNLLLQLTLSVHYNSFIWTFILKSSTLLWRPLQHNSMLCTPFGTIAPIFLLFVINCLSLNVLEMLIALGTIALVIIFSYLLLNH